MNRLYYQNGIWCFIHSAYVIGIVLFLFNFNVLFTKGKGKKTWEKKNYEKIISLNLNLPEALLFFRNVTGERTGDRRI